MDLQFFLGKKVQEKTLEEKSRIFALMFTHKLLPHQVLNFFLACVAYLEHEPGRARRAHSFPCDPITR
jgi:hypothetical protein